MLISSFLNVCLLICLGIIVIVKSKRTADAGPDKQ